MDTAFTHQFPFILDRNLAKANDTENHACTSCDAVVLDSLIKFRQLPCLLVDFATVSWLLEVLVVKQLL